MSGETIKAVAEFHQAFRIGVRDTPGLPSKNPKVRLVIADIASEMAMLAIRLHREAEETGGDILLLRLQLLQEELAELAEAMANGDLVECLDALADQQYVLDGAILALGMQNIFLDAFKEVHRSNMTKLDEFGKPIINEAGRVVKSNRYKPPDLQQFLFREGQPPW